MPEKTAGLAYASVDPDEIARFSAIAAEWWDPRGKFRPLHKFNPVRLAYIRDTVARHFGRDTRSGRALEGIRLLDIGCGGGLLAEPMTRLGAAVVGIDASDTNIAVASTHAREVGLEIDYRHTTAEALVEAGEQFDVVLNMEVVEHVADVESFIGATCTLLRPGGAMIVATLNRTAKSLLLAKIGAEYVLRWLPAGTHDWRKFLRPAELSGSLRRGGADVREIRGVVYNPFTDSWSVSDDIDVNYMIFATRPQAS